MKKPLMILFLVAFSLGHGLISQGFAQTSFGIGIIGGLPLGSRELGSKKYIVLMEDYDYAIGLDLSLRYKLKPKLNIDFILGAHLFISDGYTGYDPFLGYVEEPAINDFMLQVLVNTQYYFGNSHFRQFIGFGLGAFLYQDFLFLGADLTLAPSVGFQFKKFELPFRFYTSVGGFGNYLTGAVRYTF